MYRIKPYLCNFVYNLKDNRNMAITFFAEGVKLPAIKKRETGDWIKNVAGIYGKKCGDISITTITQTSLHSITPKKIVSAEIYLSASIR